MFHEQNKHDIRHHEVGWFNIENDPQGNQLSTVKGIGREQNKCTMA
jgi:hypothetical protein